MRIVASLFFTLGFSPLAGYAEVSAEMMLRTATKARPAVHWDSTSFVSGNFDGRSTHGGAMLGYTKNKIYLAIQSGANEKIMKMQYTEFGVGSGNQAGICTTPAKLEVYPLECSVDKEGVTLPGCKATSGASGLSIVDGECDSIHLYWDHHANRMQWWRR